MDKNDFFKKIKESENYYYKNNPCYKCGPGNVGKLAHLMKL